MAVILQYGFESEQEDFNTDDFQDMKTLAKRFFSELRVVHGLDKAANVAGINLRDRVELLARRDSTISEVRKRFINLSLSSDERDELEEYVLRVCDRGHQSLEYGPVNDDKVERVLILESLKGLIRTPKTAVIPVNVENVFRAFEHLQFLEDQPLGDALYDQLIDLHPGVRALFRFQLSQNSVPNAWHVNSLSGFLN